MQTNGHKYNIPSLIIILIIIICRYINTHSKYLLFNINFHKLFICAFQNCLHENCSMKNSFLTASSISNFHCSRSKSCSFRIHLLEPNVYCKCFKKRNVDLLTMFLKKFTVKFLVLLSIRDDIFVKYLSGFFITFIMLHIFI